MAFGSTKPLTVGLLTMKIRPTIGSPRSSKQILGDEPRLQFNSANTLFPGKDGQPVHSDIEYEFPTRPFAYCVNVTLKDVRPETGSTEFWPGTHKETSVDDQGRYGFSIRPSLLALRSKSHPPIQPVLPKGSLIIRDLRLWHAGMPNLESKSSPGPRVVLIMIWFARWYRTVNPLLRLTLDERAREKIEKWEAVEGVKVPNVEWVDVAQKASVEGERWYLKGAHDHTFDGEWAE